MIEGSKRSQGRTKIASCPIASKDSESLGINVDPAKTQTKWKQMIHMDDINLLGLRPNCYPPYMHEVWCESF